MPVGVVVTAMTTAPARVDVTMMYLIHDALRRDLDRMEDGLHGLASMAAGPRRRALIAALRRTWSDFDHYLDEHHRTEEEQLWPMVRKACPLVGELLDDLEGEHAGLEPLITESRTSIEHALTSYPTFEDATRAADIVGALRGEVRAHLKHEEEAVVPYIEEHLGAEWAAFEERQRRESGRPGLIRFLPWVLDDADPIRVDSVRDHVPGAVFAVINGLLVRRRQRVLTALREF